MQQSHSSASNRAGRGSGQYSVQSSNVGELGGVGAVKSSSGEAVPSVTGEPACRQAHCQC